MDSFNLESDPQSRGDPVLSPDASRSSSSLPLRVPGDRRNQGVGGIIQSQFDEMDAALRGGSRPGALNVHAAEFVPCALRENQGGPSSPGTAGSYQSYHSWGSPSVAGSVDGSRHSGSGAPFLWGTPPPSMVEGTPPGTPPVTPHAAHMEPTDEEQAWLDAKCTAMEDAAEEEEEWVREESWVQRQMRQHPQLSEEDARSIYEVAMDDEMEDGR